MSEQVGARLAAATEQVGQRLATASTEIGAQLTSATDRVGAGLTQEITLPAASFCWPTAGQPGSRLVAQVSVRQLGIAAATI